MGSDGLRGDALQRRRRLRRAGRIARDDAGDPRRVPGRVPRGDRLDRFPAVIRVSPRSLARSHARRAAARRRRARV